MSSIKTIREDVHDLIIKSRSQGIVFSDLIKMLKEENGKIREELLEERVRRSDEERMFRKKAIKKLNSMKNMTYQVQGIDIKVFKKEQQINNCLELLCTFYVKGIENDEGSYSEMQRRLEIQKSSIQRTIKVLNKLVAVYYGYKNEEFQKNEALRKEKIESFMAEIQSS